MNYSPTSDLCQRKKLMMITKGNIKFNYIDKMAKNILLQGGG